MGIPDLNIPDIQIQPIFDFTKPVQIIPLTINVPGCSYQHRDIKNTVTEIYYLMTLMVFLLFVMRHFLVLIQ